MDRFNIGDLCLTWECDEYELEKGEYFEQFRIEEAGDLEEIRFKGELKPLNQYDKEKRIIKNYTYELIETGNERLIIYHWAHCRNGFAIWPGRLDADKENICYFDPALKEDISMNFDWFFGITGLHKTLMQKDSYILHGSYIDVNGTAVVFSAPSGTGKSTQAELWRKYASAEIINGDRVLIRKRGECWHAFGFPSCGSSDICVNRTLPIGAVVILKQGIINEISQLSVIDKVKAIATATEFYHWDHIEMEKAFEFAQDFAMEVPIIQLGCRPDEGAVKVLKKYLQEEGICR